jgi:hypothetical protein
MDDEVIGSRSTQPLGGQYVHRGALAYAKHYRHQRCIGRSITADAFIGMLSADLNVVFFSSGIEP